ncbi:beta-galactosidase [Enterococcus moraviensis ATCC BAA-383]|uniref:Beta-galactosidase n=1 Tax=Enterococcus moraviensis ATCC BAA-383 TaxID=1158609 RepID=R2T7B5_9ENTE|nr:beta-galactosidase family protein [Enterococcus moraviensis]EOH96149.1 beta-galactosidase [Enterococcus moraviensis ATCC BAA-383]EOT66121.1 beta-galactosidase [Enterococcus moraviensis ATCC BAA-383]OJG65738.1 beta-galactosidase [Enterococcus moraviensis]
MHTFEVKEDFLLDGHPFKIMSGAIHYFRIRPQEWYHSLYNLKALGFNTVETYIPWNLHEQEEGKFDFTAQLDIQEFVRLAQKLGLFVILRPSPYICAEWEFGGMPAWLLNDRDMRIRSSDPLFIEKVANYYEVLFKEIGPLQIDQGGPVIMMQLENEYGSYGEDKDYLLALHDLMIKNQVKVPLFTSDGAWEEAQRAGALLEKDILSTGNFGSKAKQNFKQLKNFHQQHGKNWPLMCMEFWDGWFNRWNEEIVKRDPEELAEAVGEVLEIGSINLYMFHGGTNFGFMNGCSARGDKDLPQITSYDYDALLDEQGNPTEKFFSVQRKVHDLFPDIEQSEPLRKSVLEPKVADLKEKVSLFSIVESVSQHTPSKYPENMEKLNQHYGYLLYSTKIPSHPDEEFIRVIDASDRVHVFLNQTKIATQYREEIGEKIFCKPSKEQNQLDILVENMGRVNYGHKLLADTQRKGIRSGVMSDLHFICEWDQYSIDFSKLDHIDYKQAWIEGTPAFYRYELVVEKTGDTFIDLQKFGKGVVIVNGFNLGRFWNCGPTQSLYVPASILNTGINEIIVFETEGEWSSELAFEKQPKYKKM